MLGDDADIVNLIKLRMQIDTRMEAQWNVFRRVWQQRVKAFSGFQSRQRLRIPAICLAI